MRPKAWTLIVLLALAPPSGAEPAPEELPPPRPAPGKAEELPPPRPAPTLTLGEVLRSVEAHYPMLRAVLQQREMAAGRALTAAGVFDLNLSADTINRPLSTFEHYRANVTLNQYIAGTGASYYTGYRIGVGEFPFYEGNLKTADGGEFLAGLAVPLLRNRAIDKNRAEVRKAQIEFRATGPEIARQRLGFLRSAGRAYWGWVAAGYRLDLARALLKVARERDEQIEERVRRGAASEFELLDNRQNLAQREGLLATAERAFRLAAIELSLFLRDPAGRPLLPDLENVPPFPAPVPGAGGDEGEAMRTALALRPELAELGWEREKALTDLRFAENQLAPALNAITYIAQDVGDTDPDTGPNRLYRRRFDIGLELELPVQRRAARGLLQAARARLAQIEATWRFTEDTVQAEVLSARTSLEKAYEIYIQARRRVDLARRVAEAERERLRLGQGNVLAVTLRELNAFEAESAAVSALYDYFAAVIDYQAALGVLTAPPDPARR